MEFCVKAPRESCTLSETGQLLLYSEYEVRRSKESTELTLHAHEPSRKRRWSSVSKLQENTLLSPRLAKYYYTLNTRSDARR